MYCVNYWVSLVPGTVDKSNRATKNVDAYINDTLLNWNNGVGLNLVGFVPQIKCTYYLTDTLNWMPVSGLYKAKGGERHITIGNFNDYNHTDFITTGQGYPRGIGYFLDDVSVTPFVLQQPNLGANVALCPQQYPFALHAPLGYDSLIWSNGTLNATTINITQPGKYWLRCVANNCGSLTDTIIITNTPTPLLKLTNDTTLCTGQTISIASNTGFANYNWNTGATTPSININTAGAYVLNVSNTCGLQTDTVFVKYDSIPSISIYIGTDTNICANEFNVPLTLFANQPRLPNYYWSTGQLTATITTTTSGVYWLQSNYYCGNLKSNYINVTNCPPDNSLTIWLPNSFTPNNDGLNDAWQPIYINQNVLELYIYNRWGQKIFTGNANNNYSWDGTFKNQICEQGVYGYLIVYKTATNAYKNQGITQKTGVISVVR